MNRSAPARCGRLADPAAGRSRGSGVCVPLPWSPAPRRPSPAPPHNGPGQARFWIHAQGLHLSARPQAVPHPGASPGELYIPCHDRGHNTIVLTHHAILTPWPRNGKTKRSKLLSAWRALQLLDFFGSQIPPLAGFEASQAQGPDADTNNTHNRKTKLLADFSDLALSSLTHSYTEPSAFALSALKAYIGRCGFVSILQNYPPFPSFELVRIRAFRN